VLDRRAVKVLVGVGCRLHRGARFEHLTFLPHARERMEQYGITEEEVHSLLEEPANREQLTSGGSYAQKLLFGRLVRMTYNADTDEAVVVSVMLRRRRWVRAVRISYDKKSGAFTIYLREGKPDHIEDLRMALKECGRNLDSRADR
jgi:Domain of unknown function (DUF4258)